MGMLWQSLPGAASPEFPVLEPGVQVPRGVFRHLYLLTAACYGTHLHLAKLRFLTKGVP